MECYVIRFVKYGRVEEAVKLFMKMPYKNVITCTVMIDEARELFEQMPIKTVVASTAMITGFCKEGRMDDARDLFDQLLQKDHVAWNALITGYSQYGSGEDALKLFLDMIRLGIQPNKTTIVSILTACASLTSLKEGRQFHSLVVKYGFGSNLSVCNAVLSMYSKCGSVVDSELAFSEIHSPDVVSWNTILAGFAHHGLYGKPVHSSMRCVLKVDDSKTWFDSMVKDYGIPPRSEHYACLVDILCRRGQLDRAYKIIQEMAFVGNCGIWGALLAACHVYLNVELGELAAKKILELDPHNSGVDVMLSNIYARCGMWKEVAKVRGSMKEQGVKKLIAYSWTQLVLNQTSLHVETVEDIVDFVSERNHVVAAKEILGPVRSGPRSSVDYQFDVPFYQDPHTLSAAAVSSSEMQEQMTMLEDIQEELNEVKGQLSLTEKERDRALDEMREIKRQMNNAELNNMEALQNANMELQNKEKTIESLKSEVDKLKQLELKLNEKEDSLQMMQKEVGSLKSCIAQTEACLADNKKKVEDLEDEVCKRKESETKLAESMATKSSQVEQSKLQVTLLEEKMQELEEESQKKEKAATEETQNLKDEILVHKENATRATEKCNPESLETKNLASEAEDNSKKALDDLAVVLKEVSTESNQFKEKLTSTVQELEAVKAETDNLKNMLKSNEEKYEALLKKSKIENDQLNNTIDRLRLEAEESLLAFNEREIQFVNCIKKTEDEKNVVQEERNRLAKLLKEVEGMSEKSKEENKNLRDILKQALNEANAAKEAASLARAENSSLKDALTEKDKALVTLAQETERLRINEAEANESIKELKRVITSGSKKELASKREKENKEPKKVAKKEFAAENTENPPKEYRRLTTTFSFDLNQLWPPIPSLACKSSKEVDEDLEEDDALGGSIFDLVESPGKELPACGHRRTASACSSEDNFNFDNFDEDHFDDMEMDRASQGKRKALLRRFGDLLRRKSTHPPKDLPHPPKEVAHSPKEIPA
ncbi:hypothetical protein RDABS01_005961 [Bienertia sinuspersici]